MSEKVIVKNSGIHGKGLFSTEAIKKDELIGVFECTPTTADGIHVLWIEEEGVLNPFTVSNDMKYANHSDNANSGLYLKELYAERDIEVGEEITFHYGEEWD